MTWLRSTELIRLCWVWCRFKLLNKYDRMNSLISWDLSYLVIYFKLVCVSTDPLFDPERSYSLNPEFGVNLGGIFAAKCVPFM
jgi:hypothetical protein